MREIPGSRRWGATLILTGLIATVALGACNSATPSPSTPVAAASPPPPPPEPPLPALEPVATPDNLVAWASLGTPGASLDTALQWAGLNLEWRNLLASFAGPAAALLPEVDWSSPMNLAITLDKESQNRPRFHVAVSLGLNSAKRTLEAFRLEERAVALVEPGVHSIRLTPRYECFVSRARTNFSARMVCSDSHRALIELHPYLTRGQQPLTSTPNDLSAEIRFPVAWNQFGQKAQVLKRALPLALGEIASGDTKLDTAVHDAAIPIADELLTILSEISSLRANVHFSEADSVVELHLATEHSGQTSWFSRALALSAQHQGPPPSNFWGLPSDSTVAYYHHLSGASGSKGLLTGTENLLLAAFAHLQIDQPAHERWVRAYRSVQQLEGAILTARGLLPETDETTLEKANRPIESSLGYWIAGATMDPSNAYGEFLDASAALYADPSLQKALESKLGISLKQLPTLTQHEGKPTDVFKRAYELVVPPEAYRHLTADALPPAAGGAPLTLVLLLARSNNSSWIGLSSSKELLESTLGPLISRDVHPSPTLGGRSDLQTLRSTPAGGGGFVSLASVLPFLPGRLAHSIEKLAPSAQARPVFFFTKSETSGAVTRGSVEIKVPKALVQALGGLAQPR